MAAVLTVRVYTGATAGTESAAVTGIDLLGDADNATNTLANRQAHPIDAGSQSYEKWLKLKIDTPPANGVTTFQVWGDGAVQTSTTLFWTGAYVTGVTPTSGVSAKAATSFATYTSGNKGSWDTNSYSATNATTQFAIFQLAVDATCGPGNWGQETINYSYSET